MSSNVAWWRGGGDVAGARRRGAPRRASGLDGAVRREGTHNAEILRTGAGAPRGLRRRDHNAEARGTEERNIFPRLSLAPPVPRYPPFTLTFKKRFY